MSASNMTQKAIWHRVRWLFLCLLAPLLLTYNCGVQAEQVGSITQPKLAVGDWVFRQGASIESYMIASFGNGDFSHIGMVVQVEPETQILHATTNDFQEQSNQVLLSTWQQFTNQRVAKRIAVARPQFLSPEQRQRISTRLLTELGKPFVLAARDQEHLYCTTIMAAAIEAEYPAFEVTWSWLDQPLVRGEYLHPEAFAAYQGLEWVQP